jgi:hypothetical protein
MVIEFGKTRLKRKKNDEKKKTVTKLLKMLLGKTLTGGKDTFI